MLAIAAEHVKATNNNRFRKRELDLSGLDPSAYGNFPAIARFGLIAMDKTAPKGLWLITPFGWQFLRGQRPVKSWVKVKNGHVRPELGHGPLLRINQLKHGIDPIQTTFEYYDDNNQPVGIRPAAQRTTNQMSLI